MDMGAQQIARDLLPEASIALCVAHSQNNTAAQLALIMHALNELDAAQARTVLARTRDFVAPRIIVIAGPSCPLVRLDFLALGYEMLALDETDQIALYHFDLANYKQVPDWLNARYWAHPERWKP